MTETFQLGGDPSAIRGSAQQWANFASAATGAASDVGSLDSAEFIGDEGDTYRGRVNSDMTPHLKTTGEAWSKVSAALLKYAGTLEALQGQMNTLRIQAGHQQTAVQHASTAAADARPRMTRTPSSGKRTVRRSSRARRCRPAPIRHRPAPRTQT
jgi:hypothetical protein